MKEILYIEIPTPNTANVCNWLQQEWQVENKQKMLTPDGIRLKIATETELSIFIWSLQRTTYLKIFLWGEQLAAVSKIKNNLVKAIAKKFPLQYPAPPEIDLSQQSIFEALKPYYPQTVSFFQKMPMGENDLKRVYWWEKRWRESVKNPQQPKQVVFKKSDVETRRVKSEVTEAGKSEVSSDLLTRRSDLPWRAARHVASLQELGVKSQYDLIYIGGALGSIHAAVMAKLGYRVLLVERLAFGRMNREWNISRSEFQSLIDLGLFTTEEFESIIAREYKDGFSKFFDGNNPPHLKAAVLHTPTVLNIAIDTSKLLKLCGEKLRDAGGEIWDETEFIRADISSEEVIVQLAHLPTGELKNASARLLIDAMGTASPIAWQLNGGRTFDSVCPTVGAVVEGFAPSVWDATYGDVLNSHGDISRGRQLIWELFPAEGDELTIYLFHYHEVHPDNPGSLLEMYEDFFSILPEYRRCEMEKLTWKKATFGYIPGHFSTSSSDRSVAFDRLLAIGDAASLQSPLVFTGFGSLVRNLSRLTTLLNTALQHDLLQAEHLNQIRAYQSNVAVTWMFSKGMMVPTWKTLPPQRINSMLNTFFGLLANEPQEVADTFIKDRFDWLTFNRLALKAARQNPALIPWIWEMAGSRDLLRWLGAYFEFTIDSAKNSLLKRWFPNWLKRSQPWLEKRYPILWLKLLSLKYSLG
ncbi:MAG: NAD(P)/FAD-dependent oxidoreductase [Xenococcaceae cyanobacterium]